MKEVKIYLQISIFNQCFKSMYKLKFGILEKMITATHNNAHPNRINVKGMWPLPSTKDDF